MRAPVHVEKIGALHVLAVCEVAPGTIWTCRDIAKPVRESSSLQTSRRCCEGQDGKAAAAQV